MISFSICLYKKDGAAFWLTPSISEYFADPFVLGEKNDLIHVLFERYDRFRFKGEICLLTVDLRGEKYKIESILNRNYHMSYPCVFSLHGHDYVIPESESASRTTMYRVEWASSKIDLKEVGYILGRYVDLTVHVEDETNLKTLFYTGTSNNNGLLLQTQILLNDKCISFSENFKNISNRRPAGKLEHACQPYQRIAAQYGDGLDFIDKLGNLVTPEEIGLSPIVGKFQGKMHHIHERAGVVVFDVKSKVNLQLTRRAHFGTVDEVSDKII